VATSIKNKMSKRNKKEIVWLKEPADHNYPSAVSYLSLIVDEKKATLVVDRLKRANICTFKARDIFRASGLPLLGISQHQIDHNLKKIKKNEALSPILLIRDSEYRKVIVADGYHRLCAIYHHNDNMEILCKIVDL
jgi:hypothetical protein